MIRAAALILLVLLSGCGGGGAGGGGSAETGARLLHAGLDLGPAALGEESNVLQSARFAQPREYASVGSGRRNLSVSAGGLGLLASRSMQFEPGMRLSILLTGGGTLGEPAVTFLESPPSPDPAQALVRLANGAHGAGAVIASISGKTFPAPIPFASASEFIPLSPGPGSLLLETERGDGLLASAVTLSAGEVVTFVVAGEKGYFLTLTRYAETTPAS